MRKQGKSFLALLAVFALSMALFAACAEKEPETTTTAPTMAGSEMSELPTLPTASGAVTESQGETVSETASASASGSEAVSVNATPASGTTKTTATTEKPASAKPVVTKPLIEQRLDYFNGVMNAIKTNKPGYTSRDRTLINRDSVTSSNNTIKSIAPSVIGMFASNEAWADRGTVAKGADHSDFPVSGQPWASRLAVGDVTKIDMKQEGDIINVMVYLKDEVRDSVAEKRTDTRYGKAINIQEAAEINAGLDSAKSICTIDKFAPTYRNGYIQLKVNAKTGAAIAVLYHAPSMINMHISRVIIPTDLSVGIEIVYEAEYTMK